jgi:hypothetical protein
MTGRLGIDLSSDVVALADVRQLRRGRIQLRGFALLETDADAVSIAEGLRRARREHRFPKTAEVVAWARDPRVQGVRDAGFAVERVITPGEALARVERIHRAVPPPGSNTALISLHVSGGALAIVRDGQVRHETPLTWSASTAASLANPDLLRRYAFLSELTELLRGSFDAAARLTGLPVTDILTCGSLPELRSFTMPLADEFDVEVETLDSTDGLDVQVKGPAFEQLLESIAALQIAIAAGRLWHKRPSRALKGLRIAVPAGLAAGAFYAIAMYGFGPAPGQTPLAQHTRAAIPPPRSTAPPPRANPPAPAPAPARTPTPTPEPLTSPSPPPPAAPPASVARDAPVAREAAPVAAPRVLTAPPAPIAPVARNAAPVARANELVEPAERVRSASFSVTSILWSPGRQLAVVDGRILGLGDMVDGARIVEIQEDAVFTRDRAGRLRRALLSRPEGQDQ